MRRLLCLLAVLPAACGRPADAGRLLLDDGRRVAALARAESTAVLFYDPSRCFSCSSTLPEWIAWRVSHPEQVRLVLTARPTEGERRQLKAGRAQVDGLVPGAGWMVEGRSMLVVLLVDGREAWTGVAGPSQVFTPQQARQ